MDHKLQSFPLSVTMTPEPPTLLISENCEDVSSGHFKHFIFAAGSSSILQYAVKPSNTGAG